MEGKNTKETQQYANSSKKTSPLNEEKGFPKKGKEEKFAHGIEAVVRAPMEFPIPKSPDKNKTDKKGKFTGSRKQ